MKRPILAVLALLVVLEVQAPLHAENKPRIGMPIPAVVLRDITGHSRSLAEFKNQPFTLFFFCGCRPCHDCASLWAQAQQAGEISRGHSAKGPATLAVFLGDAEAARQFVSETGLAPAQTLMLTDPSDQIGQRFGVIQCPRAFVINARGFLVYTNSESTRTRLSAPALVSRILTAWHRLPEATALQISEKRTTP